jgi:hypothetical protein
LVAAAALATVRNDGVSPRTTRQENEVPDRRRSRRAAPARFASRNQAGVASAHEQRGSPAQIELAHLAEPTIGALLTERGYRLVSFENVLGIALEGKPERVTPPGIEVRLSDDDEFDAWLDVVAGEDRSRRHDRSCRR